MSRLKSILPAAGISGFLLFTAGMAHADTAAAEIFKSSVEGTGITIGTVTFVDTPNGLEVLADLIDLPPGGHGFHVHANPSCAAGPDAKGVVKPAMAAGGHLDPKNTGKHLGPEGGGHEGDLPVLMVKPDGTARETLVLKGVTVSDVRNHALVIHAGGDNYSDTPEALGGGGDRIACGVIQ